MDNHFNPIKVSLFLAVFTLVIFGFVLLWFSYLPFEQMKTMFDTLALDGHASFFTQGYFQQICVRSRLFGVMVLMLGSIVYLAKRQAQHFISSSLLLLSSSFKEFMRYFNKEIRKEDKAYIYALFIILLSAIAVRLAFLFLPMQYDEAFTFNNFASQPLYRGLTDCRIPNNHIFHTLLVHIAYLLFGNHPWAIRLPAFFAGVLLVPASYLAFRVYYNKYAALLTASLVASSSYIIEYSTNARGYTLICLLFLLILALAKYLKQNRNPAAWLIFVILSTIGFYTIPIMLCPFSIVVTWFFLSIIFKDTQPSRLALLKDLLIALVFVAILTFALYIPVFMFSPFALGYDNKFIVRQSLLNFLQKFMPFLHSVWDAWNRDLPILAKFFLAIGFFSSLVNHKRLTSDRIPLFLAAAICCLPFFIIPQAVFSRRIWLFMLPLYLGLASSGLTYPLVYMKKAKITKSISTIYTLFAVILTFYLSFNVINSTSIYNRDGQGSFRDVERITAFFRTYLRKGDKVVSVCPADVPLVYYFNLYGISSEYLDENLDSGDNGRIFVVVKKGHALEYVLKRKGLVGVYRSSKIILEYDSAKVYEINIKCDYLKKGDI